MLMSCRNSMSSKVWVTCNAGIHCHMNNKLKKMKIGYLNNKVIIEWGKFSIFSYDILNAKRVSSTGINCIYATY